jgi:hypothetical protein
MGRVAQQRIEHVARSIRVGEQLAIGFLVESDADVAKEGDGILRGKRAKDAADRGRAPAPEIGIGHARVGDVAARSAADEYFCAGLLRTFEERDRARGIGAAREDGGGEAGGTGAYDDDICDASILRAVTFEREPLKVFGDLAKELVDRLVAAYLFGGGGVVDAVARDLIARLFDERSANRSLHRS